MLIIRFLVIVVIICGIVVSVPQTGAETISKHFKQHEYACGCACGFGTVHTATLIAADGLRDYLGVPIRVNSGCRCIDHNRAVGGAPASWHMPRLANQGESRLFVSYALDLAVDDPQAAADWLADNYPYINSIVYENFIHLDSRSLYL